jgi:hypothetical protein
MQVRFLCHAFFLWMFTMQLPSLDACFRNVESLIQALVFFLDACFCYVKPLLQALVFSIDTYLCNVKPFLQALV